MVRLTERLQRVADAVPQGARLVDVGTDHGKLPIWLLQNSRVDSAIGTEIAEGPLSQARQNAALCGVQLDLRQADGLDLVSADECDTITIAGMGGTTIAGILQRAAWTAEGRHLLLLQPMTKQDRLRQALYQMGFCIEREVIAIEDRRFYPVLAVRGGIEKRQLPLAECMVSPALLQDARAGRYISWLLERARRAAEGMAHTEDFELLSLQNARVAVLTQALKECRK